MLINAKFTAPAAIKTTEEAHPTQMSMLQLAQRLKADGKNDTLPDSLKLQCCRLSAMSDGLLFSFFSGAVPISAMYFLLRLNSICVCLLLLLQCGTNLLHHPT